MQASKMKLNDIRITPFTLIISIAFIQCIIAFCTDPMIFTFDEAMWQYIGRNWIRNGMVPYVGGVDNKSPLIFLIFGISDWFFGVSYWFPRLFGIAVQSAGIYYLFKIAEKTISRQAGIFAISLYGLSLLWRSTGGKYVSYTETYAVTSIIISIYFSIACQENRLTFIGGLFAGLGFGFRLTAVFGILPMLIFTFYRDRKAGLFFLTGTMVSMGMLLVLAELAGIRISDFWFYGVVDNFGVGSPTDHALAWKVQRFGDGFFYSEIILFYPAVFCYFLLVRKMDFLKTWLISEFLGIVILGMYDRNHFKNLLPVFSLTSAFTINYLIENHRLPPKMILLGIWIIFFPKTFEPLFAIKKFLISGSGKHHPGNDAKLPEEENLKRAVGLWIRSNTRSGDQVYVAGYGAQVQLYAERISPSIYFNATQTPIAKRRLYRDLLSNKPSMIAIPLAESYSGNVDPDVRHFISQLTKDDYQLDTCIDRFNIFRYKGVQPMRSQIR
jgi:hypothetical protein